jgi:hypothetical protein
MPSEAAMKLWTKYREIRQDSLREHEDIRDATEFYKQNHKAMNEGAEASWSYRFNADQVDAVQFGMDQWAENERRFWAEYQNQPMAEEAGDIETLKAKDLLYRVNGLERKQLPEWATKITAFIDVQQDVLVYVVTAWADDLTGSVIDFGTFPEQHKRYWTVRDLDRKLRKATGQPTIETALSAGLEVLVDILLEEDYDGMQIGWLGIDANWELSKSIVYKAAKKRRKVHACHGKFVGAASLPMDQWKKQTGEKVGTFWRMKPGRIVSVDVNSWKSIVCKRLKVDLGAKGSIDFFGQKQTSEVWADQLAAEFAVNVKARGREVQEWKCRPGQDNHYFDCLVGSAVGCSFLGGGQELVGKQQVPGDQKPAKRRTYAEIMAARRANGR